MISKASAPTGWLLGNGRLRETRRAVMVWPRSGSLMTALMVRVEYRGDGVVVGAALVVAEPVVVGAVEVLVVAEVVPAAGAVGSAVTADSPLQAASATTGARRPATARRRRRVLEAVDGRAGAAAEVFISRPA